MLTGLFTADEFDPDDAPVVVKVSDHHLAARRATEIDGVPLARLRTLCEAQITARGWYVKTVAVVHLLSGRVASVVRHGRVIGYPRRT